MFFSEYLFVETSYKFIFIFQVVIAEMSEVYQFSGRVSYSNITEYMRMVHHSSTARKCRNQIKQRLDVIFSAFYLSIATVQHFYFLFSFRSGQTSVFEEPSQVIRKRVPQRIKLIS